MPSLQNMMEFMQKTPIQEPINNIRAWIPREQALGPNFRLLEVLANLPLLRDKDTSVLDRTLEILSAQYDADYDRDFKFGWAWELRPLQCRRLGYAVGSAFTRAFTTKLHIPLDGCYSKTGIVGRAEDFLDNFSKYAEWVALGVGNNRQIRGAIIPTDIKELVFYQDPLWTGVDYYVRNDAVAYTDDNLRKRLAEDIEEGKMLTVTPKRSKLYEKLCKEVQEAYVHKNLVYDEAKLVIMWVRIIDVLRFLPNLETFRWLSDAVVMEPFLGALSQFCPSIKVLELHLSQPFGRKENELQAWNRIYKEEHTGLGIEDNGQHERIPRLLRPPPQAFFGVSYLSLISTSTAVGIYTMGFIAPRSIQSLEIKGCKSVRHIYQHLVRGVDRLRKFKITFESSDDAKERAYSYWKYHVVQMRETLDFLRAGTFALDELDIQGDFGVPTPHPVEASGLTPDLFFAISAQAASLVRLRVVNTNIDFSFEELATIVCKAPRLTQLAITCRAFQYIDVAGNKVQQGLGTPKVFDAFLGLFKGRRNPLSLTLLRSHYHPLGERLKDRDAAGREIAVTRELGGLVHAAREALRAGVPLKHLGLYSEDEISMYVILAAQEATRENPADLVIGMAGDDEEGNPLLYEHFDKCNTDWIEYLEVPQPPGIFTHEDALESVVSYSPTLN